MSLQTRGLVTLPASISGILQYAEKKCILEGSGESVQADLGALLIERPTRSGYHPR